MKDFHRSLHLAGTLAAALLLIIVSASLWGLASSPGVTAVSGQRVSPAAVRPSVRASEQLPFRYDVEYPFIRYANASRSDRIAALAQRLAAREARLELRSPRGYLDSLLEALDIDPASQTLVFSATSLQTGSIRPHTPRAIYFDDDVYIAWTQGGGPIEIASMDPQLGPVFYTLEHRNGADFESQVERCLRCHDSFSLSGGGVPRFITGSGYIGTRGDIVTHEGWILTSQRTPLRSRWGGWYVTGRHGEAVHLGNIVVRKIADLTDLESLRRGNLDTLDGVVDTSLYAAPGSDIVALLVMQHQIDVQNQISRVNYKVRAALEAGDEGGLGLNAAVAELAEPLVEAMLFVGEASLPSPVSGSSHFRERFERRGPFDRAGRTLRALDLEKRLMRYPLSYLVYSAAFDALPEIAQRQVYRRFAEVLRGRDRDEKFAHLSDTDRALLLEILSSTKPQFAAALEADEPQFDAREGGELAALQVEPPRPSAGFVDAAASDTPFAGRKSSARHSNTGAARPEP